MRLGDGHTLALLQVDSIVADGRLEVCDGAHWAFVMKKDEVFSGYFEGLQHQRARPSGAWTGHPPDFQMTMVGWATRRWAQNLTVRKTEGGAPGLALRC